MLIVIAIIAILLGMVAMTTTQQIKGMEFNAAVADIGSLMEEARQVALIENRDVQIRIYRHALAASPTTDYRAIAIGHVVPISDPTETDYGDPTQYPFEPIGQIYRLPVGVRFIDSTTHSTLLTAASMTSGFEMIASPDSNTPINAEYRAFQITPHEGAALPINTAAPWTLTLGPQFDKAHTSGLPINFATFTVSPQTGKASLTRP